MVCKFGDESMATSIGVWFEISGVEGEASTVPQNPSLIAQVPRDALDIDTPSIKCAGVLRSL